MKISIYLAISLIIVSAVLGMSLGYYLTPEYRVSMYDKNSMNLGQADKTLDLRYINAMIAHHRGAMLLASQLAQGTSRAEMKALAKKIQDDEPKAIQELYDWKREWYGDRRSVRDPVVAQLGPSDDTFDLRFLNAMIAHHEAGVVMTKEARQKSSRSEVLNNVDLVEAFLISGIKSLKELRSSWYGI